MERERILGLGWEMGYALGWGWEMGYALGWGWVKLCVMGRGIRTPPPRTGPAPSRR